MFDRIIEWLEKGEGGDFPSRDVRTAVAAIYYHMMAVDGAVTLREIETFTNILGEQFDLDDDQIHDLMHRGAETDASSPSLFPFASIINSAFDIDKRMAVMDHLVSLADSDGIRHPLETELLEHLAKLFKLSEYEAA
ncbi:TerB family tellurite resistance protein [Pseudahrensia aquimaris]|uniref:TerB family tellurite resistance protein n=1 Tax=Pseudahrensia aquimaris TaxID=744461 RepID=A0ABW3FJC2_9HYPH